MHPVVAQDRAPDQFDPGIQFLRLLKANMLGLRQVLLDLLALLLSYSIFMVKINHPYND
jgi:hypothetical protein